MKNYIIHIISLKCEICSLIKKTLSTDKYTISCILAEDIDENYMNSLDNSIDCLILDKDVDEDVRKRVKEKLSGTPIISLPSLGNEIEEGAGVKYMTEPFKLSELKKTVDEITSNLRK
jgi:DNA-binding response OmpR family regulator